jgi:eukaryotic-like serine/threonine-protein kinase
MIRRMLTVILAFASLLFDGAARAQNPPAGYDLTLVGLDGSTTVVGRLPASVYAPRVAPDGARVAFETRDPKGPDGARLWTADLSNLAARTPLPLVVGPVNWAPMWSLDGERLVFIVSGDRPDAVYWRRADGTGQPEHLVDTRAAEGWNGGGSHLRFITLTGNGDYGISQYDMKSRVVTRMVDLPNSAQHSSAVSPDGRWIAYASNETGRYEVWLEPIPATGVRHQLTRDGGSHPLWVADGRALYFDRDHQLFRLDVNTKDPASKADPVPLPIKGFAQAEYRRQFDLMPNGRQFLMLFPVAAPQAR